MLSSLNQPVSLQICKEYSLLTRAAEGELMEFHGTQMVETSSNCVDVTCGRHTLFVQYIERS